MASGSLVRLAAISQRFERKRSEELKRTGDFDPDGPAISEIGIERARSGIICGEEWRISSAGDQNS
jgi:hypothetical protein